MSPVAFVAARESGTPLSSFDRVPGVPSSRVSHQRTVVKSPFCRLPEKDKVDP